jgi:hypothetical protein
MAELRKTLCVLRRSAEIGLRPGAVSRKWQLSGSTARLAQMSNLDFDSEYRVFAEALAMLASSAEEQCEAMGNYNVAWELKDDVQAGKYLVGSDRLNAEQVAWILTLACALDAVPATTLPAGADRAANLAAMRHPSWIPLRVLASQAREALSSVTAANAIALGLQ